LAALIQYKAAASTDRGRKRASNEDAFGYSVEHGIFVVCDGMGGAAGGEIASSLAVDEVMRLVHSAVPCPSAFATAEEAVPSANQAIYVRAQRNQRLCGMGTTMVVLAIDEHHVHILNVGDSRCYWIHDRHLSQITLDHSLVEEQIRAGRMTRLQAAHSPLQNVITRALGTQTHVTPDFFEVDAQPGDLFLLCTDGLTRELTDLQIETLLNAEGSLDELCQQLIQAANKAGGRDNITCILVRAE